MIETMTKRKRGRPRISDARMTSIHIQIPLAVVDALDDLADESEYTRSAIIRLAIYQYLNANVPATSEGRAKAEKALELLVRTSLSDGAPITLGQIASKQSGDA